MGYVGEDITQLFALSKILTNKQFFKGDEFDQE